MNAHVSFWMLPSMCSSVCSFLMQEKENVVGKVKKKHCYYPNFVSPTLQARNLGPLEVAGVIFKLWYS